MNTYLSRFTFEKKQITFNKENLFDLSNQFKSTEKSIDLWLSFGEILLDKFYSRYQKKLNEEINDLVQNKYMICLHREEMAILDPFLAILESSCFDD